MDIKKDTLVNGIAYTVASIGTIVGQAKDWHGLEYVCKPLMLVVLSSWFYFNSRRVGDRFTVLIQVGLFFSLVGDVALMFQHKDEFNFLIGLAAFMLVHVCYALAFALNISEAGGSEGALLSSLLSAVILVFGWFFTIDLVEAPHVGDALRIPVVVYAVAITLMGIAAAFRFRRTYPRSFWLVFAGAVLFILSDALLANLKFSMRPVEIGPAWVMVTYAAAQFLIVSGCLLHVFDPEVIRRKEALTT